MTAHVTPEIDKSKIRRLAIKAGARTDGDFALYTRLVLKYGTLAAQAETRGEDVVHPCIEKLLECEVILERGRFFEWQVLPSGYRYGEPNQCFGNSFDLAKERRDLIYCEGIAALPIGSGKSYDFKHAWCVASDGNVIDVTFDGAAGMSYFGVPYAQDRIDELGEVTALPLLDELVGDWWLFRDPPKVAKAFRSELLRALLEGPKAVRKHRRYRR
jgi:hypothetical protein